MLKQISRLFRDQLERKLFNKKDRVDYSVRNERAQSCYCKHSKVPVYVLSSNKNFNYQRLSENINAEQKQEGPKTDTCNTSRYLKYNSWFEALGLSSTFAFAYTLNQNFHVRRRKFINELGEHRPKKNYCIYKKVIHSQTIWKNLCPKHVFTQPPALTASTTSIAQHVDEQEVLPCYGPQTAEEAVREATEGVRNAHNVAISELENRQGMRCMSKKRYRKAVVHFSAGMALANSSAAYNLAQCYELGLGTSQDFMMAAKCYRRASDLGNATAMYNLAVFYVHGWGGLKSDRKKAEEWMQKAAALGEPNAKMVWENRSKKTAPPIIPEIKRETSKQECRREVQAVVDSLTKSTLDIYHLPYSKFDEITPDSSTSTSPSISRNSVLFSEFDHSDSSANYYSGICYENGIGVKQNFDNAVEHYSYAAFSGNSPALYNLAACYETSAGSNQSDNYQIPLLMDLYKMAADRGHQYASERLKVLEIHEVLGTLKDFFFHSKTSGKSTITTR